MVDRRLLGAMGVMAVAVSCAVNPATGHRQLSLVPKGQEIEMGKQSADEVAQSIGIYDNARLNAYVSDLGKKLAAGSERPELPWTFKVVDDSSVNAFALPGGYIFVTRGILAHLNNEAQLASVVGHEIGHVTAKHAVNRISKAELLQLGLGVGMAVSDTVRQLGQVGMAGLQVLFLKFSRDDENQADELGLRYSLRANYDVNEMPKVFETLERVGEKSQGKLPEWLSTHPYPEHRVQKTEQRIAQQNLTGSHGAVNADVYNQMINGITFGPNPREGFFDGDRFLHPDMKFTVTFPSGWQHANTKEAVMAASPDEDGAIQITMAKGTDPAQTLQAFFSQEGVKNLGAAPVRGRFPTAAAQFSATTEQGEVSGIVTMIGYQGKVFQFLAITPPAKLATYATTFMQVPASFNQLTDPAALNAQPGKLQVERAPRAMTLAQLYQERAPSVPLDTIALINQMQPGTQLAAGQPVKIVRGGMGLGKNAPVSLR
jgi:predicted Zn-dependent protease